MNDKDQRLGAIYAAFSYCLWGILPIYWKLVDHVAPDEILANRILWSFVFTFFLLYMTKRGKELWETIQKMKEKPIQLFSLFAAGFLVSGNWFIYIWAVNSDHMIEASLGYYINPLVSVLLGMLILKEKLSGAQILSFLLASVGVIVLTVSYGSFPWVALSLAISFGLYGLAKKLIQVEATVGLTLETFVVAPFALAYIVYLFFQDSNSFLTVSTTTDLLLIGAGPATAIPLLYFGKGAQKIPLSMLGFLQYIAPTLTLLLGIFIYGEHFTKVHLISFLFIWLALIIYSLSKTKFLSGNKRKKARAA